MHIYQMELLGHSLLGWYSPQKEQGLWAFQSVLADVLLNVRGS
jgi:hypothetical protein